MSQKEREALTVKQAKRLAIHYLALAAELEQAATVLNAATNLQSAFPTVSLHGFSDAINQRAILRALLEDRLQ